MDRTDVRIVALSDLHGTLPLISTYCDVVVVCGDIVPLNIQRDTLDSICWLENAFFPWCMKLKCEKVVFVAGNHDFVFETLMTDRNGNHRKPNRVMKKLLTGAGQWFYDKIKYLENSELNYKGYKFYGSPWCPELSNWAFYKNDFELKREFNKIPNNIDVLLTHCPPAMDTYGMVMQPGHNYMNDYGCVPLADAIKEKQPRLCLFGHVHSGCHTPARVTDNTVCCNVSIKDEDYNVSYVERVFTLKDKEIVYENMGEKTI